METNQAATWLLAEGDEAVVREEEAWKAEIRDADMVRQTIEDLRYSRQVTELAHEEILADRHKSDSEGVTQRAEDARDPETMRVWTDGACIKNGTMKALAG